MTQKTHPIPVALVITDLHVGGAERMLVQLATGLDRSRFAPMVFSLFPEPPEHRRGLVETLQQAGISIYWLNARSWWSLPRALFTLWRHFRREQPRIVQSFLFHANFVSALVGSYSGIPRIFTGIRVAEPRRWHLRLARWTDRLVTRHVCVSQAVADYSETAGHLPASKLTVIHNCIDTGRFANVTPIDIHTLGLPVGRRTMTVVGRLDAQKGLDWLLQLAPRIFSRRPNHDLLIVGDGPAKTLLTRRASELGIDHRVRFLGWRADVPEILAASDVLLLPSEWEGLPNVVLEAMALGKPVVARAAQGVREVLGPLAADQACEPSDSEGFLRLLQCFLDEPEFAAAIGQANQNRAHSEFPASRMVASYEGLYTSMP